VRGRQVDVDDLLGILLDSIWIKSRVVIEGHGENVLAGVIG
jgi:hypothetical protein